MPDTTSGRSLSPEPHLTWPAEGDPLWVWRGVKGDATTMYPALALEGPSTLGGTLGVRVQWWNYDTEARTDFIALTHVEERREPCVGGLLAPVSAPASTLVSDPQQPEAGA